MISPNTPKEFMKIIQSNNDNYLFLSLTKTGCPACNSLKDYLRKVEEKKTVVKFINLDVSVFYEMAKLNKISAVPTSMLVKVVNNNLVPISEVIIGFSEEQVNKSIMNIQK